MDPGLFELYENDKDEEVSAIIRLNNPEIIPDRVHLVSRFGEIATCRLRRSDIPRVHDDPAVKSLKAPRGLINSEYAADISSDSNDYDDYIVQRPNVTETGRGVVIGIIDWGCDFAHPDFIDENGESRLICFWLQKGITEVTDDNPYGRGQIFTRQDINEALTTDNPYEALHNHPGEIAPNGASHGSHTMGIAAGNGYGSNLPGIAPDADLIFVQADSSGLSGLANFGDSVGLLEAVDFILKHADNQPCVINMSMGRCGGPHDGCTLVELGLDSVLLHTPGLTIVNSTGNYYNTNTHASGQLETGQQKTLTWIVDAADQTPNELEVWYSGDDQFTVQLTSPNGMQFGPVQLDNRENIIINDDLVGRIYHRSNDPNNAKHHIDIFLYTNGPTGEWQVLLNAVKGYNGRFDAWIERDVGPRENHSRFKEYDVDHTGTTGTIANGRYTIAVGAYDARSPGRELAPFSSSGPTADNRQKPELVAPGVRVVSTASAPMIENGTPLVTAKSGTSMAAPHVAGTVALMYEAAKHKLPIQEIRQMLFTTSEDIAVYSNERYRLGHGYLNMEAAIQKARSHLSDINIEPRGGAIAPTIKSVVPMEHSATTTATLPLVTIASKADVFNSKKQHAVNHQIEEKTMNNQIEEMDTVENSTLDFSESDNESYRYALQYPATVFDSLVNNQATYFEQAHALYETIVKPGAPMADDLRTGDILIERVLGEGELGRSLIIESLPITLVGQKKLGQNSMILRPRNQENISHNLAPNYQSNWKGIESQQAEGLSIAAVGLGLAALKTGKEIITSGKFSFKSMGSSFMHDNTPTNLPVHAVKVDFKIKANHPDIVSSHPVFWFSLEFEYNGFDIKSSKIIYSRPKSDSLRVSDFSIEFYPFEYSGKSDRVCIIRYDISGSWDPLGFGDVGFTGDLFLSADGKFWFKFQSDRETWLYKKAYVHQPKFYNLKRIRVSTPRPPMPTVRQLIEKSVYFTPKGSFQLDGPAISSLSSWYKKLPAQTRADIEEGKEVIKLTGFASTLGSVEYNQDLGARRVENVKLHLKSFASNIAKFVTKNAGQLSAKTLDGVDDPLEQRVDILIVGPLIK